MVTGPYSDCDGTVEHPERVVSFKKEAERVVQGHFHERVDESLGQDVNFGTSRSKTSCFVSEIRLFEHFEGSKTNFPCLN